MTHSSETGRGTETGMPDQSPKQLAQRHGVQPETILRWIREGRLKAEKSTRKVIRIEWQEWLRFKKANQMVIR